MVERKMPLSLKKEAIEVEGTLQYHEGAQAWNTIRLKKDFIGYMPKLKDKTAHFSYSMVYHFDYDDIIKVVKKLKEENGPLPILLFFNETINPSKE